MDQIIKKKLARNWFKTLQEVICQEIEELEELLYKRFSEINNQKLISAT